jgi:polysaccharide export outer membrane protein
MKYCTQFRSTLCLLFFAGFLMIFSFTSCKSTKELVYFGNIQDTLIRKDSIDLEPVIQRGDLLSITVSSLNPEASQIFNTPNFASITSYSATGNGSQSSGYLVNQDGFIQFPVMGNIKAAGLTKKQLKDNILKNLTDNKLLVDPIVNVRFINFRVTVLGEVAHPTVVSVPGEQITIMEALGLAGDLTLYARRDNILLIREESGQRIVKRLNLNSSDILKSPYYYLKSNDIVYAEPNKVKAGATSDAKLWLPVIFSGLTLLVIATDRLVLHR